MNTLKEITGFLKNQFNLSKTTQEKQTTVVHKEQLLWNDKPIKEGSLLLWDLENIPFNRLSEIKRVVKYTPQDCYIITTQKLSLKKRKRIQKEGFTILDAHKTISDDKILFLMKLYKQRKDMVLISSDSDFAREANRYLKEGKLHWVLTDVNKKRVTMKVNLASPNLTISTINLREKSPHNIAKNKVRETKIKIDNEYTLKTYLIYYKGRLKNLFTQLKALFQREKGVNTSDIKEQHINDARTHVLQKTTKQMSKISSKFGLHLNKNSGISHRYIFRLNQKRKMTISGKVQYNPNKEILLILHKNLKEKYDMPSYGKVIRLYDLKSLGQYIWFDKERDIYCLNDFKRIT